MPLAPQLVRVDFGAGLEQKTDVKKTLPGRLVTAQNLRLAKEGRLDSRPAFTSAASLSGQIDRLYSYGDQALAFFAASGNGERIKAYDSNAGAFRDVCEMPTVPRIVVDRFGSTALSGTFCIDCAVNGNYMCIVMRTANLRAHVSIIDLTTNKRVGSTTLALSGSGMLAARVVARPSATTFAIAVSSGTSTLDIFEFDPATLTASLRYTDTGLNSTSQVFDVAAFAGDLLLAYPRFNGASDYLQIFRFSWWTFHTVADLSLPYASTPGQIAIAKPASAASTQALIVYQDGSNFKLRNYSTSSWTTNYTTSTALVSTQLSIVACEDSSDVTYPFKLFIAAGQSVAGDITASVYRGIYQGRIDTSGNPTSPTGGGFNAAATQRGLTLNSKPIAVSGRIFYWARVYNFATSDLQTTLFLCEYGKARPLGMALSAQTPRGESGLGGFVSSIAALPNGTYACGAIEKPNPDRLDGVVVKFSLKAADGWRAAQSDDGAKLFTGGYLSSFDGVECAENGFLLYPFTLSLASDNVIGSKTASGKYSVIVVFERTDALGRLHRSQASDPVSITLGASDKRIRVTLQTLQASMTAVADPTVVTIAVYCTTAGGTTYYREGAVTNDPTHNDIRIDLTSSDATISANSAVYTSGNAADDVPIDAPTAIALGPSRFYGVSGNRFGALQPAKELLYGIAGGFYPDVVEPVHIGDEIKGVSWVAGRLFAFKDRATFNAVGDGPDLTGQNDTLSPFDVFSLDVGLTDPASLVTTTLGAVFRSKRGFYLLGRDGSMPYIGADVEDASGTVIDAAFCEDKREVKFLLSGGTTVLTLTLFETKQGIDWRWTTDTYTSTPLVAIAAVGSNFVGAWNNGGTAVFGLLTQNNPNGDFGQNTADIYPVIETGWISFAGLQGYGRLWSMYFLGSVMSGASAPDMDVDVAYDYVDSYTLTRTITGANATSGGTQYQFELRPSVQQCQAVKLRFRPRSWGLSFSNLMFEVGVSGAPNLRDAKRV